jgi:creatinine amidohydrolase
MSHAQNYVALAYSPHAIDSALMAFVFRSIEKFVFYAALLTPLLAQRRSVRLEDLTWKEASDVLTPQAIVMIPLGAASKEHGPHLKLSNDYIMAEFLAKEVMARTAVVVAPTINYNFYPAFVEYPGATSLRLETARDLITDICRGLARFGPRKFYILNTGVSTLRPLRAAAEELGRDRIQMRFTDILHASADVEKQIAKQPEGTHADEIETSIMLYIAPESVNMTRAAKDFPHGPGPLQWRDSNAPQYSPSGVFGDATLATREKGEKIVRAQINYIVREIEKLKAE